MYLLGDLAPSSQTVGSLLRTPLLAKPAGKMINLETYFFTESNCSKFSDTINTVWQLSPNSIVRGIIFFTIYLVNPVEL
jgi:hypothetical protein